MHEAPAAPPIHKPFASPPARAIGATQSARHDADAPAPSHAAASARTPSFAKRACLPPYAQMRSAAGREVPRALSSSAPATARTSSGSAAPWRGRSCSHQHSQHARAPACEQRAPIDAAPHASFVRARQAAAQAKRLHALHLHF
eukprot:6184900-Pleurochrysis_carterae.AAC.6